MFSPVDGTIRPSDSVDDEEAGRPGLFSLPGTSDLFRLRVSAGDICVSSQTGPHGKLSPECRWRIPLKDETRVQGVVGGDGIWAILEGSSGIQCGIELNKGWATNRFRLNDGERVVAVAPGREPLISSADTWRFENTSLRSGEIVSSGPESFITRHTPKDNRHFLLHSVRGDRKLLLPPPGWNIEQALVSPDGFLATCVHKSLGFALWDGESLRPQAGTVTLTNQNGAPPVVMIQGNAIGTVYRVQNDSFYGLCGPDPSVQVDYVCLKDSPCVVISGKSTIGIVVSLHGGPDSFEWDDLRYSGLYRTLAHEGIATVILNAPGSRGLGNDFQRSAWGDWNVAVEAIVTSAKRASEHLGVDLTAVLGVSFGGWLAVQAADRLSVRAVTVAPILDLASHLVRHSVSDSYTEWAALRFGTGFRSARYGDQRVASYTGPATVFIPEYDRVIDHTRTRELAENNGWQVVDVPEGHVPSTPEGARIRWKSVLDSLTNEVGAR